MNVGRPDLFSLSRCTTDLDRIEATFPTYLKLRSICWLLRNGAPSTEGLVLTSASPEAIAAAAQYARSRGWSEYLLRHDSPRGFPRSAQGGFLIELDALPRWVAVFVQEGVCMLLEPLNPLLNGYNVSCLLDASSAILEIVGPGFDASDLQRGQALPHETGKLDLESGRMGPTTVCRDSEYSASVAVRERKIWWKLVQREVSAERWRDLKSKEIDECRRLIVETRGDPLPPRYKPMPSRVKSQYLQTALPVLRAWRDHCGEFPAVIAGSFVQDRSFRFWDANTASRWLG